MLEVLLNSSENIGGVFQKKYLDIILKLVSVFILAGFTSLRPDVYAVVELVGKHSIEDPYNAVEAYAEQKKHEKNSKSLDELSLKIIKYQLESKLLSVVDFSLLIEKLMKILASLLNGYENELEHKDIAENALVLLVSCLLHKNSLIEIIYNFNSGMDIETLVCTALTHSNLHYIPRLFSNSLLILCQNVGFPEKIPTPYFLSLLLRHISSGKSNPVKDYTQFFATLSRLVELYIILHSHDCTALLTRLMSTLLDYQCIETRGSSVNDKVLVSLLSMCEVFLTTG